MQIGLDNPDVYNIGETTGLNDPLPPDPDTGPAILALRISMIVGSSS